LLGAIPKSIGVPAGTVTKGLAFLKAKSSNNNVVSAYTSTTAAAASALLWIACKRAVVLRGSSTKAPPSGIATHKPKAAPLLFIIGSKNPDATTTIALPSKVNDDKG